MKKIKTLLIIMFSLICFPSLVNAASGKINLSSTSTVVVGNNVTVTVTLSSQTSIGSWEMSLIYDKNYLQLKSTNSESNGTRMAASSSTGVKSKTYTFTFKTLKKGSTKVSVDSYLAYAFDDMSQISLTSGSKQINIITQEELEASYSKNNNLSSLSIQDFSLTPEFNSNTLEYSVIVPEGTKEITINATAQDRKTTITGTGTKEVTEGNNKFEIVARAQSGAEKTYIINVEVKDENPINVTIDGKNYTVVKLKENLPSVNMYEETTITIDKFEIPAYKNDFTNIYLVGLKDDEGNISLFIYNKDKNEYLKYNEIGVNKITIYPLETNEEIEGYTKGMVQINDVNVQGYYYNNESNFVIIYGVNIENGDKGFYMYDKESQTLTKYNEEYIIDLNKKIELYTYIIIGFSALFVLMIILIIVLSKNKKHKKKIIEPKPNPAQEEKLDKNTIVEKQ